MSGIGRSRRVTGCGAWLASLSGTAWVDAAEDIRDIRGPKTVPPSWITTALIAIALAAAIGAVVLWRRRRRPARRRVATSWESALERLDAARPLMSPTTAREFGIAASEAIRRYIEQRFEVVATQQTTEEFLQALTHGSQAALARHRVLLADFLQECDVVKFAGASLTITDMEALMQSARGFVLETRERSPA